MYVIVWLQAKYGLFLMRRLISAIVICKLRNRKESYFRWRGKMVQYNQTVLCCMHFASRYRILWLKICAIKGHISFFRLPPAILFQYVRKIPGNIYALWTNMVVIQDELEREDATKVF